MIKKYYVVYITGVMFHKGVFAAEEINEDTLKDSIDSIKEQIMSVNPHATDAGIIGILSWQEL